MGKNSCDNYDFQNLFEMLKYKTVKILCSTDKFYKYDNKFKVMGTGCMISSDGVIITNFHVIKGAKKIKIQMHDKTSYHAKILYTYEPYDFTVIKIDVSIKMKFFSEKGKNIVPGEVVLVMGHPYGLEFSGGKGIVSAVNRSLISKENNINIPNLIQLDANCYVGHSGGPVINLKGDLIGIIIVTTKYESGITFVLPISLILSKINDNDLSLEEIKIH